MAISTEAPGSGPDVPEEKRRLIEQLAPLLDELVSETIRREPEEPAEFMLRWLEARQACDEDRRLSLEEQERLHVENMKMQQSLARLTSAYHEVAAEVADGKDHGEHVLEDDNDGDSPPDDFKEDRQIVPRRGVSEEAHGEWNRKQTAVPPVIPKTDEQRLLLNNSLRQSFPFDTLEEDELRLVVAAMSEACASKGEMVVRKGAGNFAFVVERGTLDCINTSPGGERNVVKTCKAGDVFGELALLYDSPRAVSVVCTQPAVIWRLDRGTFGHIVKDSARRRRSRHNSFLSQVPLLASMSAHERLQLTDALQRTTCSDGDRIVVQGEPGDKLYILEAGEAVAACDGKEVMRYNAGDYFGELALLWNQPWAATVCSVGQTSLLGIGCDAFKRLVDVSELLARSTRYA